MKSLILIILGCFLTLSSFAKEPTNILLITADDMNLNSVGIYNCTVAGTTPNTVKLAVQGMSFDYTYVQIAMCTPFMQVMLSGNHSHHYNTWIYRNIMGRPCVV